MRSVSNRFWGKVSSWSFSQLPKTNCQLPGPCDCDACGNTIVYEAAGAGGDWFANGGNGHLFLVLIQRPAAFEWSPGHAFFVREKRGQNYFICL